MKLDGKVDGCRAPLAVRSLECVDKNRMETEKPVFDAELGGAGKDALRTVSKTKGFTSLEHQAISEYVVDHKPFSGLAHDNMLANNADLGTENKFLPLSNYRNKVSTKDLNLYTEEAIEEGSAMLITCDKGSRPSSVIKDACVDEGRQSDENHLGENHEPNENRAAGWARLDPDAVNGSSMKLVDSANSSSMMHAVDCRSILDRFQVLTCVPLDKRTTNDDCNEAIAEDVSSGSLDNASYKMGAFSRDETVTNKLVAILSDDLTTSDVLQEDVSSGTMENALDQKGACDEAVVRKSVAGHLDNLTTCDVQEDAKQVNSQEATSDVHLLNVQSISNSTKQELSLPSNSKIGNKTITFDFEPSGPRSCTDGNENKDISKKPPHPQFRSLADSCLEGHNLTDERSSSLDRAPQSCEVSDSQRRSVNLNQADVYGKLQPGSRSMSESITFSGPVPYSGSISLRSDSSTTSTRSFAFPILNPEWNSSPVKMAKANRGHFRKHRWWRMPTLCCRF